MTIIFNVAADGSVQSTPAYIPQGVSVDVVVVSPFYGLCTVKVTPPSQMYAEDAFLTPAFERGKDVIWTGRLPKTTANTAGKLTYQIQFDDRYGRPEATYSGTLTVQRGVVTLMPDSAGELSDYTIDDLYRLLASITGNVGDLYANLSTDVIYHESWSSSAGSVALYPNTVNIVRGLPNVQISVSDEAKAENYWSSVLYIYVPDADLVSITLPSGIPAAGDDLKEVRSGDVWEIHVNNIGGAICKRVGV